MGGEWRGREEGSKKNKGVKVNAGPPQKEVRRRRRRRAWKIVSRS